MAIQRINLGTAPSGTGGDTNRSAFTKIDGNFADSANAASRLVGTAAGNVMEVGAFGLGSASTSSITKEQFNDPSKAPATGFYTYRDVNETNSKYRYSHVIVSRYGAGYGKPMMIGVQAYFSKPELFFKTVISDSVVTQYEYSGFLYHTSNTTVDPNGFIKAASPIVSVYADKIECNDEAAQQDITFEKLGVGDYLLKGSLGLAQEGWYIEMPKDANGNVLVAVIYEQLANNDISVKTYAKKFDEETGDVVANTAKPRDIPATRWIDLRLQALPQPTQPLSEDETVNTNAE